jgi:hypothetical protein
MVGMNETLLLGPEAVKKVTGRELNYSNFFRWTQYGLRDARGERVRLKYVKCGMKRMTSIEAVRRFFAALTPDGTATSAAPQPGGAASRRLENARADQLASGFRSPRPKTSSRQRAATSA